MCFSCYYAINQMYIINNINLYSKALVYVLNIFVNTDNFHLVYVANALYISILLRLC